MPRIFFHIGLGKAGSSAIQSFLFDNRELLRRTGFCFWRNIHTHHVLAHKWGGGWLPTGWAPRLGFDHLWQTLRNEVETNPHTFIISSERFAAASFEADDVPDFIARMFEGIDTRIILYLRPHVDLAESEYKQRVRRDTTLTLERFLANLPPYFDFKCLEQRWTKTFGEKNVIVRQYIRDGLIADFLSTVGANIPITGERRVNVSPGGSLLDRNQRAELERRFLPTETSQPKDREF